MIEEDSKTKEKWIEFIRSQILREEQKRNKYGLTLWILIGSFAFLIEKLITLLFILENTDENILQVRILTICIFLFINIIVIFIINVIDVMSLRKINSRSNTEKDKIFFKLVVLIEYIIYALIFRQALIIPQVKENKILVILILISCLITTLIIVMNIRPLPPKFFFEKKTFYTKIKVILYKNKVATYIINIFLLVYLIFYIHSAFSNIVYTYEIVLISILINICMVLGITVIYLFFSYYDQDFYEILDKEIFLTNMNSNEIREIVERNLLGESTQSWILEIYNKIEEYGKSINLIIKEGNTLENKQFQEILCQVRKLKKSLDEYKLCNINNFSLMDRKYGNKCYNKIEELEQIYKNSHPI